MFKSKFQFWTLQILMIVGIIYLSAKISFLFKPIVIFTSTLFLPILISGICYFLFNPVVSFLERRGLSRTFGIILLYLIFVILIVLGTLIIVPIVSQQITGLLRSIPVYLDSIYTYVSDISTNEYLQQFVKENEESIRKFIDMIANFLKDIPEQLFERFSSILGVITNVILLFATVPFILFYMFKDGYKFPNAVSRFFPQKYRPEVLETLKEMNGAISTYVTGQLTVAFIVGVLTYVGYLILDVPYALVLSIIAGVTNIIPYLGPFIGAAPAVVVALFYSPTLALLVILWVIIAQQLESNLISPLIIGKTLKTHPVTIIIILLVAGNLAGVMGMVLAIPVYAVTKVFVQNVIKFINLRRSATQVKTDDDEKIIVD